MKLINPFFNADDTWLLAADRQRVWDTLTDTSRYPDWWPWLDFHPEMDISPAATTSADVRSPLGYHVRFELTVVDVVRPERLELHFDGQIRGSSVITLADAETGTALRMEFAAEARSAGLRAASGLLHRPLAWAHNEVIRRGIVQFKLALKP